MGEDSESVLANGVNEDKIAFSGLSLGAYTTMLAALDPERADPRVDAILPMALAGCYVPKHFFDVSGPPMVILHGTADAILPYEANAPMVYDLAQPSKRLISLLNGTHTGFADISADVFQHMEHADEVGCIAIAGAVPDFDTLPFNEVFGEVEFVNSDCPFPCEGVELIEGMNPLRQIDLLFAVARAFLDETLKEDYRAGTFLDEVLNMEPDVDVIYQHTQ
jgi:predicted esterase